MQCIIDYRTMSIFATNTLMFYSHVGLIWQHLTKLINVLKAHSKTPGINGPVGFSKMQTCVESNIYDISELFPRCELTVALLAT